jgi:hypothetical protein
MRILIAALLLVQASALDADVVRLVNGDRVSGRVVGPTTRRVRVQTPYGPLVIPRQEVDRIERDDGSVEVLSPPPTPAPLPTPPPSPVRLQLAVSGDTFWQAWDKKAAPSDPSLRLELRLDDTPLVSYTDGILDPEDMPKAIVNSFVFSAERLYLRVCEGVVAAPPIVAGSEIGLALQLPPLAAGLHWLHATYQLNDGTPAEPFWHDVVASSAQVALEPGRTLRMRLQQSRGAMEYARKRMQNVATFTATLHEEGAEAAPADAAP